jgi:hypothetical protein
MIRWAEHVACMEEKGERHAAFGWGKLKKGDHFQDLGVDGSYYSWGAELICLRVGAGGGLF